MKRPLAEEERAWLQEIGARLQRRRQQHGRSQSELADLAGLSMFTVSRAETGVHAATVVTLGRLCEALDWSVAELFGEMQ